MMGGGVHDTLAAQMVRDGIALPDNIANQPMLASNLIGYLDAFYDLDTERNHGLGLTRIPWSKIIYYAEKYAYDEDELLFFVRKMDDAHLEWLAKGKLGDGGSSGSRTVVPRPPRPD